MTSDSRSKIESLTESSANKAREWREESAKDTDGACADITSIGANNLEVINEARNAERRFFKHEQVRDTPTGATPSRANERNHPRQPLTFTPDEERTRRYRTGRDLGAAMRLQIQEEDDDIGSDDDSVFSASTNMTESRRESTERAGSVMSVESEEIGYGSDRVGFLGAYHEGYKSHVMSLGL